MASGAPYLSVVATARNDDHGGNLLGRMQLFVTGLLEQCRRHALPAELVLVEWNPVPGKPRLAEALSWPADPSPCAVRVVEVPAAVHARYKHARALPLYQMIAKNVGIRRARGEFVLATNIDLLFNDELVRFIAGRNLRADRMYRTDRHDVPADVPPDAPLDDQLEYCRRHRIRVHTRNRVVVLGGGPGPTRELSNAWLTAPWRKKLKALVTWPVFLTLFLGYRVFETRWAGRLFLGYEPLHAGAAGDFTLLSREAWFRLRGHAELDLFSLGLDTLLTHAAHHAGYREEVLPDPMRVYHVEHGVGSGWTPEGEAKLNARLAAAGIEQLTLGQLGAWAGQMAREKRPLIFSGEDWGLAGEALPETVIGAPAPLPVPA